MSSLQPRGTEQAAVAIQAAARGFVARKQVLQSWRAYRECFPEDRVEHLRLLRDSGRPDLRVGQNIFITGKANPYDVQVRPREPRPRTPEPEQAPEQTPESQSGVLNAAP